MSLSGKRTGIVHGAVLLLYTLLAIGMTLPLALRLSDHLLGTDSNALNDTYFSVWIFGWQAHQLIADPLNLFQGNIFYPFANTLAFSEIILPGALLYLPLEYASGNPVLAYNLVVLLSFPLNGLAMYLYALDWLGTTDDERWRTKDEGHRAKGERVDSVRPSSSVIRPRLYAAFLAGLIFAFCTYKFGELRHVQLLMAMFMPLTLMYLARVMRAPSLHNAFLVALFFALNALSSLYYAVFLALACALYLALDLFWRRARYTRAHFVYGFLAAVIATALVLPFLLPFLRIEREFNFSEGRDPRLFSARPYSYLATPASQWLYGSLTRAFYVASKGQPLFPGIGATVLGLVGLAALVREKRRAWVFPLLLGLMSVVLSFGPELILGRTTEPVLPFPLPFYYLSLIVTPLKSLNAPSRFVVLAMLALALLGAYGLVVLLRRFPRYAPALAVLCAAVILIEYIPAPLRLIPVQAGANISPVYQFLRRQPRGEAVVELPMGKPSFADQDKYVVYTYNAVYHLQPLVNGYSTLIPQDYYALVRESQSFPSARAVNRLRRWGAQWFVVHSDRYPNLKALRRHLDKNKHLEHVQDFGEIWLYRVREE